MILDEDVLEKEDLYILDRMKAFVSSEEVAFFGAAKQLLIHIDRVVRAHILPLVPLLNLYFSNEEVTIWSRCRLIIKEPPRLLSFPEQIKSLNLPTSSLSNWHDNLRLWKVHYTRKLNPWNVSNDLGSRGQRTWIISLSSFRLVIEYVNITTVSLPSSFI